MKKLITLLFVSGLFVAFTACNNEAKTAEAAEETPAVEATTEETSNTEVQEEAVEETPEVEADSTATTEETL